MGERPAESTASRIDALFRLGVLTGLSDGQLLERFVTRSNAEGQLAFEAIVRRHGPMVLGVCRRVLGHQQAAEDAFQASFMVLALKAGAVRSRASLGPWLHGVAARIARRVLLSSRRHRHEPLPAEDLVDASTTSEPVPADLAAVIDEELGRLPDKYRIPVVLCYLEGQTQEQAARALGWSKGTVSGRLARAKDLLRVRLARRGLAPSAVLLAGALAPETASAAVPSSLMTATVRIVAAAVLGGAEAGLASGSVSYLARAALKWMLVAQLVRATAILFLVGTVAAAVAMPKLISGGPVRPGRPGVARVAAKVPGAARPGPPAPASRVDLYGDPLPNRAAVRLGTIQRRHTKRVVGVEFAGGGKAAVSVQADGLARFWDVANGQEASAVELISEARDPNRFVQHFAISPDGRTLAATGSEFDPAGQRGTYSLWIWELEPQRLRHRLQVQTPSLYSLAFSPDGATVALGGFGGDVQLWDVASGSRRAAFKIGNFPVTSIRFAPDGKSFAATSQGRGVTVWDLEEGRGTVLAGLKGSMFPLRFSPDGRLLAVPQTGEGIALWDRTVGEVRLRVPGTVVAFAPDSRAMAVLGTGLGTMTVLDTRTGAERWKFENGWSSFANLAFSPDGSTILAEGDGVLRFFDADSGRERYGLPEAHQAGVTLVRYAPDGRTIFTGGNDATCASGTPKRLSISG